jgi:hypothetical protein
MLPGLMKALSTSCLVMVVASAFSCGSSGDPATTKEAEETASSSDAKRPIRKPSSSPGSSAVLASVAQSASSAGTVAAPSGSLTKEEFCKQAVSLSEANLASCPVSEQANLPAIASVKPLFGIAKECSMRVESDNVDFRPEIAHACIEAAKRRGGKTNFYDFYLLPECRGVVGGKAGAGRPALFAEECAPGTAWLANRCVKPGTANSPCEADPGGYLGKADEHRQCEGTLGCFLTRGSFDGNPATYACLPPQPVGAPCKLDINTCEEGTSCYQGKCRTLADADGECMGYGHCKAGLECKVSGGLFGRCVAKPAVLETCAPKR